MSYYVRLRKYGEKGPKMGEFGPFTTQKLAIKQGNALLDTGVGKDILVVVEKKKAPAKKRPTPLKAHDDLMAARKRRRATAKRKAKAKSKRNPPTPKWAALFDSLKTGDLVTLNASGWGITGGSGPKTLRVGRRGHSKKYGVTSLRLDPVTGKRPPIYAAIKLYKRGDNVSAAYGNMALFMKDFWRANGRKNPKAIPKTKAAFINEYYKLLSKAKRKYLGAGKYAPHTKTSGKAAERLLYMIEAHYGWAEQAEDRWTADQQLNQQLNPRPDGGMTIREKLAQGPVNIMALGGISKEFGYPYPSRGATIDKIRWVYDNSERKKIHGRQMDSTTASVIIQVYDALSPANQAKYGKMKAPEMAGLAWDLVSKKNPTRRNSGLPEFKPGWIQSADKRATEGAFTRQARARGYKNTMEFARKVMAGWRSGKKTVLNKKTRKRSKITTQLMQRANFAINAQSRRNPSKPRPRSRSTMLHKGRSRLTNPSSPDYALGKASGSAYQMFVAQRLPEYTAAGHKPKVAMKKVAADWRKLKRR